MKKFLFLIPLIALLSCNSGENISPADNFVKFYGGAATFELMDMAFRADGEDGVVLLALRTGDVVIDQNNTLFDRKDLYVIVTDGAGNPVNEKRIPISLDAQIFVESDSARARLTAIEGGGYYVVTSTSAAPAASPNSFKALAVWAQFDNDFDLAGVTSTWNAIGDTVSNYYGRDIAAALDDGVVVGGYTDKNGTNDFFYNKIGGTEWPPRIQDGPGSDDRLVRLFSTDDGQFVIVGRTDVASTDGEGGANVKRSLIDQNGILVNSLNYGITIEGGSSNSWDIPYDVIESPGGYTVVGASYATAALADGGIPFFMNVDLGGASTTEVEYSTFLGTSNGQAIGVTQTATNDFIVVGEVDGLGDNGKEIMILKTDQQGQPIGEEVIRYGLLNGDESARRALTGIDGTIYVGATYDFGGGLPQIGLLKLNPDGELRQ